MILEVNEGASGYYRATLVGRDATGAAILPLNLTSLIARLYNEDSDAGEAIGAAERDLLDPGGPATYDPATGLLLWHLTADDHVILDPRRRYETHMALLIGTWAPDGVLTHAARFRVRNLRKLP